jgi:translation initiation factor IF-1
MKQDDREDRMEMEGVVEEALPGTLFRVKCAGDHMVLTTLSGKLRQNNIKVLPGDRVTIQVSPYDLSRGRISWRF